MPYLAIDNFAAGLDTRKSALTSAPGTLQRLVNATVTPGGEIAKRRAFVKIATLTNTFGLAATATTLYAFTRNVDRTPPVLAVPGVTLAYQTIPNPATDLTQMDFDTYDGKIYLTCFQNSGVGAKARQPHYYDGRLTEGAGKGFYVRTYRSKMYSISGGNLFFSAVDNPMLWDAGADISQVPVTILSDGNPAVCTVAAGDISRFTNGMLVRITGATGVGTKNANGLRWISKVGTPANTFTLNGVNTSTASAAQTDGKVMATPAIPVTLSNTNPAVCTVSAANILKFDDGMVVTVIGAVGTGLENANGAHGIVSVNDPPNTFTLVNVNTAAGAAPQASGVAVTITRDANRTGQGFVNLSTEDADSETLTSLEVYYDKLAVFSSEATQLWGVDPDPAQNALSQVLRMSGTIAALSTQQYGSGDVLFLAESGVRSVRARDSSNAAAVSDIGSPIDSLLQSLYLAKLGTPYFSKARALLEPVISRFWMIFPNEIYVLSAFPGPKITAWSYYTATAGTAPFTIDYAVTCGGRIFLRADDDLYVYGGNDGNDYDNCGVEVRLPFLDMGKPGTNKIFQGIDLTASGTWTVKNTFDYNNPDTNEETLGTFSAPTWRDGKAAFEGQSTHFSLRLYNTDDQSALLSNAAIHYALAGEES